MKLLDSVLDRLWPWSELRRLRALCHEHWEFGESCLSALDRIHPPWKHVRSSEGLCVMARESYRNVLAGQAAIFAFADTEVSGVREVVAMSWEQWAKEQRGGKPVGEYDA